MNHPALHLTEDQIDDLLIGDATAETQFHLQSCPRCAEQVAALDVSIASFNAVSLAWGERRSATLPLQLQARPAGLLMGSRLRFTSATLGSAVAAGFALALALPLLHHGAASEAAHQAAPHAVVPQTLPTAAVLPSSAPPETDPGESQTSEQQIARDNQLLRAIDRELAASQTPADLLKMAGRQDANQSSPDIAHNE